MLKGNHRTADRRRRPLRSLGTSMLVLSMAAFLPSVLPGADAEAATGAAVPVAGVLAFGIGAGQLGEPGGGSTTNSPTGVAFDGKGDLFVADPANNRVVEYVPSSPTSYPRAGTVVAGAGGKGSGLNQLSSPNGVAFDAAGDLFVSDSGNNRVMEYTYNAATGGYATSGKVVAGTGTAGSGPTQLSYPEGIALDANGDLFVADTSNNRVQEFPYNSATGSYASTATTVAGAGGDGSGANQLHLPPSVALDAKGDLFVADYGNARVMEYAYNAAAGSYAASGTLVASLPNIAGWVTLDASGDLFASYGYLGYGGVEEFPYNSATGTYASTGTVVASGDQVGPSGLAFNPSGDLFVGEQAQISNPAQSVWDLVLEFTYSASAGTWSPLGTIMSQSGRTNMGVSAVAVDSHGNLFASDGPVYEFRYNSAAHAYSAQGTQVAAAGDVLALDSSNDLFVVAPGTAGVLEYPWNASSGSYASSGQAVPGATQLASLTVGAMALDAKNDLFVATSTQVLEFPYNASSGSYAASGTVIATVDAGGLAIDSGGDLFVSNPSAGQVQEYLVNSTTGTYASKGITVAGAAGTGNGANQLSGPTGVAVDHSGDLFVFDAGNARVMEFAGNQATGTYAANGTAVFTGAMDNYPETGGVALDSQGDVFFSYNYSSAVVYEAAAGPSPPPSAPVVTGLSPSTGPAAGGTAVTVSGSNLTGGSVTFGTAAATGVSCSAASCTATSPAGTGTVNVTVTTPGGTSATSSADQFTYTTAPPPANLIPNPGFESAGVPADYWGSSLARSQAVVHSGSWSLAQTLQSSSGGWDLDSNPSWYAPISSAKSYTAGIWVRSTATVKVNLSLDLLNSGGNYVDSATGPNVTLVANTWTHLTVTGIKPASGEVYGGMEPDFLSGTRGTVIYWDDMTLTSP